MCKRERVVLALVAPPVRGSGRVNLHARDCKQKHFDFGRYIEELLQIPVETPTSVEAA